MVLLNYLFADVMSTHLHLLTKQDKKNYKQHEYEYIELERMNEFRIDIMSLLLSIKHSTTIFSSRATERF